MVIPTTLSQVGQLDSGSLWKVYLPVIVLSFGFMIPMVIRTEVRKTHTKTLTHLVCALVIVLVLMPFISNSFWGVVVFLFLFFCLFNTLEALQPSLVSRVAPPNYKGLAMGFYNTTQSLGVFGGGLAGGIIASTAGVQWALWLGAALAVVWWNSTRHFQVRL